MTRAKPRHYVVVVHGIGVQKESVTAYEVINRFAEVRQNKPAGTYETLLPANLSSQSILLDGGHGWAEFRGVPIDPCDSTGPFDGLSAMNTSGRNFRFVDLRWSQILAEDERAYASSTQQWVEALRVKFDTVAPQSFREPWAIRLLRQVEDGALTIKEALTYFRPAVARLIFDDILGGIHLYGDYTRTRGKAVRHFHFALDEICLRDFIDWCRSEEGAGATYCCPTFTVVAHSLGSIMSFDALVYASAAQTIREDSLRPRHPCPSLPFQAYPEPASYEALIWTQLIDEIQHGLDPGSWASLRSRYLQVPEYPTIPEQAPRIPLLLWRRHVKHLITIGAPIDKFHVLWYQNYTHMGFPSKDVDPAWASGWLEEPARKIIHYNLYDEQDPVGGHLEIAQTCENYRRVFDTGIPATFRDVVFRRYAVPGLAHVEYWKDRDLFAGIIKEVMEKGGKGEFLESSFRERDPSIYRRTLAWAYFRIPLIASVGSGLLLSYGILGLRYRAFAVGYLLAIAAAMLLWMRPYPLRAYRQEARGPISFWTRWKLRQSLLANLVAGAIEWRRVIILQNKGEATELQQALKRNTRLCFQTDGGFARSAPWYYVPASIILVLALAGHQHPGLHLWLQIGLEIVAILSGTFLLTMLYVGYVFSRAKRWKN